MLASVLALESVRLVLPRLRALQPREIAEFRQQTKELVVPFRMEMLKLSRNLNHAISSKPTFGELQREAKFLAETTVLPLLQDLRRTIEDPARPWTRTAVDLGKALPGLVGNLVTGNWPAIPAKLLEVLGGIREDQLNKETKVRSSGFHYVLEVDSYFPCAR